MRGEGRGGRRESSPVRGEGDPRRTRSAPETSRLARPTDGSPLPPPSSPLFESVLFDCDSTLSAIEGVDELAHGHREEVARLTEAAMRGEVPLEEVYGRRLALIRPSREALERLAALYVERLVEDARAVVEALRASGVTVGIVSGGLRPAVLAAADALGIPARDVHAVDIYFDSTGAYSGFDAASPLARSGGKRDLIRAWTQLARPAVLVGDGATDLEARSAVDAFVAYAGVVARPAVMDQADAVIRSRSLAPVLPLVLGAPPADRSFTELYHRGERLLRPEARAAGDRSP